MKYILDLEWNHNYTTAVSAWNKYGQSFYGSARQFRIGRSRQELSTTIGTEALSTFPSTREDVSSTEETETSLTEYSTVKQDPTAKSDENADEQNNKRNSFTYLAPLWIVILAFTVPAVVFMLWKATQRCK